MDQPFRANCGGLATPGRAGLAFYGCRPIQRVQAELRFVCTAAGLRSISFGLECLDLRHDQFEPVQLAVDLRLHMPGKNALITCSRVFESATPIAAHRLIVGDTLGEEQPFDPIDVLGSLAHQHSALTAQAPLIFATLGGLTIAQTRGSSMR